jgi:hypothetical protein
MEYHEIMRAEMSPDVYAGESCDQIKPRWHGHCEGDMDSDYFDLLELDPTQFPPGTKVVVLQPCCPECGQIAEICTLDEYCDFDWEQWTLSKYS